MIVVDGWEQGIKEKSHTSQQFQQPLPLGQVSTMLHNLKHPVALVESGGQWQYRSAISVSSSSGLSFHQAAHCETSDGTNGEWQYRSAISAASSSGLSFHHAAQLEMSDCTAALTGDCPVFDPQKEDSVVTGVFLCLCRG